MACGLSTITVCWNRDTYPHAYRLDIRKEIIMSILYILRGLPASGKSTWRKQSGYAYVNKDEIRKWYPEFTEREVHAYQMQMLEQEVAKGTADIVIDNTNLNEKTVQQYRAFAKQHGYVYHELWFNLSVEECIERDKTRVDTVGAHVIWGMALRHTMLLDKECFIFDIDGTLANCDHRKELLPTHGGSWEAFFNAQDKDSVYEDRKLVLNTLAKRYQIFLVSGRPDNYRAMTEAWLQENGIQYKALFMRRASDKKPDDIVKREIYTQYFQYMKVHGVFDDRNTVVAMWRSLGIPCYQVQLGDF